MIKFPSIEQFRHVIREVRERHDYAGKDEQGNPVFQHTTNYPTLKFQGTVKMHGTNSSIIRYKDRIEYQSRERVLSLTQDNSGFMATMSAKNLDFLFDRFTFNEYVAIYGEFCGGNIQTGVAINGLPKMFVIFGIKVDDKWVEIPKDLHNADLNIYNILQFPTFEVEIDFNQPELAQNEIIEMTQAVEDCCPVGKYFGKEGTGEGIVFSYTDNTGHNYRFKSKGVKHSVSKVKKLNPVNTEVLNSINEFVESVVTEARLLQGLSYFKENNIEPEAKNTGKFLSWVVGDVLKEEADTITTSGLNEKHVKNAIVNKARMWFLNQIC